MTAAIAREARMSVQVNGRNRAYEYACGAREKLLFAGLHDGIDLPYECGSGTCGTCKAKLIEGEIEDAWPEAPGRRMLKGDQGEFLMCQCAPKGNVAVEIASFVYSSSPGAWRPSYFDGTVASREQLTGDVMAFDVALDLPVDFDAGQFMLLEVPGVPGFRGYSMVNFARQARSLRFVLKRKQGGGISEWVFGGEAEGAKLRLFGPLGKATFYPNLGKNVLCIAGGSGIAGMMSILARGAQEGYFKQFRGDVFFGVRTMRDAFFLDELSKLREPFRERLRVVVALSDEDVPEAARSAHPQLEFERGLVHEVAARCMEDRFQNVRAFLAGPPPAVESAIRMLLLKAKLTADNIRYDKFS
jgi:toluene monooxygenase electron transfer component